MMTAKSYLHVLAVVPAVVALIADTAEASRTLRTQVPLTYIGSDPANDGRPGELSALPACEENDARNSRVLLTVLHDASEHRDGARFYAGRFVFRQAKG